MNINLQELTDLKKKLDKKRPLPSKLVESLRKDFLVKNTYHSNAIEGNTLTVYETKAILEDGVTIGGKSMREHLEAINHKQAIILAEDIVKQKENMTERNIKELHAIIMHGIDNSIAGVYRQDNVIISGASHIPPHYFQIPEQMKNLMEWYEQEESLHPVEKATVLHSKFVNIHPFSDGNGRTSRLLMNIELMRSGYLPVNIE
jgi:Fic family protein